MHSRYKTSSHHHSAVEHTAPTSTQHKHMNLLYSEHDARSISSCEEDAGDAEARTAATAVVAHPPPVTESNALR